MSIRTKLWSLLGALVIVAFTAFVLAGVSVYGLMESPVIRTRLVLSLGGALFILAIALIIVWIFIDLALLRALSAVEKGAAIIAHTNPAHSLELPAHHLLGNLPQAIQTLARKLELAKHEVALSLRTGAMREAGTKASLGNDSERTQRGCYRVR